LSQNKPSQPPNLSHFKKMTTNIGIWQHAKLDQPDPDFGYSIDDNARALLVAYQYAETYGDNSVLVLAKIYFDYIRRAKIKHGYFHNFAASSGLFIDEIGSETSSCRTIWSLGYVVSRAKIDPIISKQAQEILDDLPSIDLLQSPRSKAYAILGYYYLGEEPKVVQLADSLVHLYSQNSDIRWFETDMAYANAILPLSLYLSNKLTRNKVYLEIANESFFFLDELTRKKRITVPISHKGHKISAKTKKIFDQQAIEATDMVLAASAGKTVTESTRFDQIISDWFDWFNGGNIHQITLIDPDSGACHDGLVPSGLNLNQGAESTVCYLLSYLVKENQNILLR